MRLIKAISAALGVSAVALILPLDLMAQSKMQGSAPGGAGPEIQGLKDPRKWASAFVETLQVDAPKAFEGTKALGIQTAGLKRLNEKFVQISSIHGKVVRSELLSEYTLGKSLLKVSYLLDQEQGPCVLNMIFYLKPLKKEWFLYSIDLSDEPARFSQMQIKR